MKGKKFQKYANIHQQFKPLPPAPLKKLIGIKLPSIQSNKELPYMQLEKVIGFSSKSNGSIALNPINGELATTAGCVICIYSPKENKQNKFLFSRSQRSFSCLTYSHTGRYLAAGEGAFKQPEITVWEIQLDGQYVEIKHLKGHKYGIESIMFSPNMNYLISLGDANDRGLFVWDWENEQRVTSNKLGKPVNTFAFSEQGQFFVTAGYQHLKYWYFDDNGKVQKTETNSKESIMESKSADLTKVKLKVFVGVACRLGQVFSLAADGHLYVYDKNRKLTKWMNIKVEKAISCTMTNEHLFCGCSDGIIRVFGTKSLEHIITLPKPPPLGSANIETGIKKIRIPATKDSKFADCLAVIVDESNQRVVVLYSDRMIFIWDIKQLDKISVYRTSLAHCGPIHDIQYIPNTMDVGYQDENSAVSLQEESSLTKFMTCSSDRTIRFWQFVDPTASLQNQQIILKGLVKNAYCKDMSRMIYVNSENRDQSVGQYDHFKVKNQRLNEDGTMPEQATLSPDEKDIEQQVRCVRISPDGKHVACGDWTGNIRVHDVKTLEEIQCIQAHESEVLCLDYSPIIDLQGQNNSQQNNSDSQAQSQQQTLQLTSTIKFWLASGSRDRLTQIYELSQESGIYENVTILEDHSSTLTSLKFAEERSVKNQRRLKLISAGADKQIVLRNVDLQIVQQNDVKKLQNMQTEDFIVVQKKEQCKYKTFSMEIAQQAGYIVTGHDKILQLWQLSTCDKIWEKKPESQRKSGSMDQIKVVIDPNAGVIISSSTDRFVTIYEAATGNVICKTTCGEVTTALCLSSNLKHLITCSTDGIIYIWRLPEQLAKALWKLKQEQKQKEEELIINNIEDLNDNKSQIRDTQITAQTDDDFNDLENIANMQAVSNQPQSQSQTKKEDPIRISEIMKQISKATGQIDKIQIKSNSNTNKKQDSDDEDEEFDFGSAVKQGESRDPSEDKNDLQESGANSGNNTNRKNRNNWGTKKENSQQKLAQPVQENEQKDEEQMRQLKIKENKLPRWARSVTGDQLDDSRSGTLAQRKSKFDEELKNQLDQLKSNILADDAQDSAQTDPTKKFQGDDIEEIFQNSLDKVTDQKQESQFEDDPIMKKRISNSNAIAAQQQNQRISNMAGVPRNAFYDRIEEDLDEDKKSNDDKSQEDDDEEKLIKEQLQRRQMQKSRIILGLDDEDDGGVQASNSDLQSRRLRQRNNESRTSLSQQFFQRKMGASSEQNLFRPSNNYELLSKDQSQQQNAMKVEDLFEDHQQIQFKQQPPQQVPRSLQQSQSQFINQTPQILKNEQESLQFGNNTIQNKHLFNQNATQRQKIDLDLEQLSQQQDLKKLAQEKYERHKKTIEEQYKKQQKDLEVKVQKEKKEMEDQLNLRKSLIENKQKEKISEIENNKKPQINILEEIESEIKKEEEKFNKISAQKLESRNSRIEGGLLSVKKEDKAGKGRSSSARGDSRSRSCQRYNNNEEFNEDESMVQINSVPNKAGAGVSKVDEAAVNATIKAEMDKINNSLARITQCLNSTGNQGSFMNAIRVKDDVTDSLSRSMGLWNSMMMTLSNRTSINVNLLQSQQMHSINQSQQSSIMGGTGANQSFLSSQISVKDDARDLLQKYSELLIEEISKKLGNKH